MLHNANLEVFSRVLAFGWVGYFLYNLSSADVPGGYSAFVLEEMKTALRASQTLRLNLSMDLPADYTPLSLAEGFYMATMGGATGTLTYIQLSSKKMCR